MNDYRASSTGELYVVSADKVVRCLRVRIAIHAKMNQVASRRRY